MTNRELISIIRPDLIKDSACGGVFGCPGGLKHFDDCDGDNEEECARCWDLEVAKDTADRLLRNYCNDSESKVYSLLEQLKRAKVGITDKRAKLLTEGEYFGRMDGNSIANLFDCECKLQSIIDKLEVFEEKPEEAKDTTDWTKVDIDTKVLVSGDGRTWRKRHFAGVNSLGHPTVYGDGQTSWTDDGTTANFTSTYIILASEVEIIDDCTTD